VDKGLPQVECDMLGALGSLLQDQGEYDRALPLLEDCLEKRKRILGDDHPDTLVSISNLADLLQDQGEYDRALPLLEDCQEKRKRILGDDHPDTLISIQKFSLLLKRWSSVDMVDSAMRLIDSTFLPAGLLMAAKQRVMDRL
jgi:tetratricopeptide (TPR) repeat protein